MIARAFVFLCFVVLVSGAWAAKGALPAWALDAVKPDAAYQRLDPEANALVVLDRSFLTYSDTGELRTKVQQVFHIRSREERDLARFSIPLSDKSSKLIKFSVWMRYPSGNVEVFGKSDLVQVAANMDALVSDSTMMAMDRSYSVRDDMVVACEWEIVEKGVFTQELYVFQSHVPIVYSRVDVSAPAGWTIDGVVLGPRRITSEISGSKAYWEARDMPLIKDEANRLPVRLLATQVGITALPPEGSSKAKRLRPFRDWNALARYGAEVQVPNIVPDEAIRAKAGELAAGTSDRWSLLQRVCSFTQSINYVMVALDVQNGGGYTPRPARDVFAKHYGDCKDMTALTRSLLGVLGIESYAVIASVGSESYVNPVWPSPLQFNHCIVAIPVDASIVGPAVVEDPQLGRLLIFDPTQRYAPLGQLPGSLQGTRVLVASDETRELLQLPLLAALDNGEQREIDVSIDEYGNLSGSVREIASGSFAEFLRSMRRSSSDEEFRKSVRSWMASGLGDATIEELTYDDRYEQHEFEILVTFRSPAYARRISADTMAFRPVFLTRLDWVPPVKEKRVSDYVSRPWMTRETIRFKYPAGFELDSRKDSSLKETSFLNHELEFRDVEGGLEVERVYESRYEVLPVERYEEVVRAYEDVTRAEAAPVVLVRKAL